MTPTLTSICKIIRESGKQEIAGENMSVNIVQSDFENNDNFNYIFLVNHFQRGHIYAVQEQMFEGQYLLEVISNECPMKSNTPNTNEFDEVSIWLTQITNIL